MRAAARRFRARASEHLFNFSEQFEKSLNFASTFELTGTIQYPYLEITICYIFLFRISPLILNACVSCLRSAYHGLTKKVHFVSRLEIKSACLQKSDKFLISREGSKIRLRSYSYGR